MKYKENNTHLIKIIIYKRNKKLLINISGICNNVIDFLFISVELMKMKILPALESFFQCSSRTFVIHLLYWYLRFCFIVSFVAGLSKCSFAYFLQNEYVNDFSMNCFGQMKSCIFHIYKVYLPYEYAYGCLEMTFE